MLNSICTVGGSMSTKGSGSPSASAVKVSPMSTPSNPARPTMLPASPTADSVFCKPLYSNSLVTLPGTTEPSARCR